MISFSGVDAVCDTDHELVLFKGWVCPVCALQEKNEDYLVCAIGHHEIEFRDSPYGCPACNLRNIRQKLFGEW